MTCSLPQDTPPVLLVDSFLAVTTSFGDLLPASALFAIKTIDGVVETAIVVLDRFPYRFIPRVSKAISILKRIDSVLDSIYKQRIPLKEIKGELQQVKTALQSLLKTLDTTPLIGFFLSKATALLQPLLNELQGVIDLIPNN